MPDDVVRAIESFFLLPVLIINRVAWQPGNDASVIHSVAVLCDSPDVATSAFDACLFGKPIGFPAKPWVNWLDFVLKIADVASSHGRGIRVRDVMPWYRLIWTCDILHANIEAAMSGH